MASTSWTARHARKHPDQDEADGFEQVNRLGQQKSGPSNDIDGRGSKHRDGQSSDHRQDSVRPRRTMRGIEQPESQSNRHRSHMARVVNGVGVRRSEQVWGRNHQLSESDHHEREANPFPASRARRVGALEDRLGEIGNQIGFAHSNAPLQTFDVVQP